tara:strand:- start:462 stop:671 length:210 start_codon:yes stop_codon:yes gene_type:complete
MMNEIFDTVEELAGIYPDSDSLRNAIHTVFTQWIDFDNRKDSHDIVFRNVDYIAREYETERGISMRIGR